MRRNLNNAYFSLMMILTIMISCILGSSAEIDIEDGEVSQLNISTEGSITGPEVVSEEESIVLSIVGIDFENASILWSVDPASAGVLGIPNFPEVGFQAAKIPGESDLEISIVAEITDVGEEPVHLIKNIHIVKLPEPESWVRQYNAGNRLGEYDICIDKNGDIFVTGQTMGSGDLDPGPGEIRGTDTGLDLWPSEDAYLSKFSPDGELLWAHIWGGMTEENEEDSGLKVATDSDGNVYVVGKFEGSCDFDPGPGEAIEAPDLNRGVSSVKYALFLVSFTGDGNFRWVKNLQGQGNRPTVALNVDKNDDLILSGGSMHVTPIEFLITGSKPERDTNEIVSLAKFDSLGDPLWYVAPVQPDDGRRIARSSDSAVDDNGYIYETGTISGLVDMDPGPDVELHGVDLQYSSGSYLRKFSPGGDYLWARTWSNKDDDSHINAQCVAVDGDGNVYMTGYFKGHVGSDDEAGMDLMSNVAEDGQNSPGVFTISYTPDGNSRWAMEFGGGISWDNVHDIAVSGLGFLYLAGEFTGIPNSDILHLSNFEMDWQGGNLAIVSTAGELNWVGMLEDWYYVQCKSLDVGNNSTVYLLGYNTSGRLMNLIKMTPGEYWDNMDSDVSGIASN